MLSGRGYQVKKYIVLLGLRIKSSFAAIPVIFAGTVFFSLILVLAAFGMYHIDNKTEQQIYKIAVVYPQGVLYENENDYTRKAFEMLGQMEGIRQICVFESYIDEDAAVTDLRKGNAAAVVVIPKHFLKSIISGENIPARVIFNKGSGSAGSQLFMEIVRAGASDLSTAQTGVYALDDVCGIYDINNKDSISANVDINAKYLSYALSRHEYFEVEEIKTGYNNLTDAQIYGSFAVVLMLLISSVTCVGLLSSDSYSVNNALRIRGILSEADHCFRVMGVAFVYWCILGIVYVFMGLSVVRFRKMGTFFTFMGNPEASNLYEALNENAWSNLVVGLIALALLLLAIFSFAGFIFKVTDKTVTGVLVLLLLTVVMMFMSGFVTIDSVLPYSVAGIGQLTPFVMCIRLCGQIIAGCVQADVVVANVIYTVLFLGLSVVADVRLAFAPPVRNR